MASNIRPKVRFLERVELEARRSTDLSPVSSKLRSFIENVKSSQPLRNQARQGRSGIHGKSPTISMLRPSHLA